MKDHPRYELPGIVSIEDTTVALCAKFGSEEEIAQAPTKGRVENLHSKKSDTLAHKVLFKILPTEVVLFAKPTCNDELALE